MTHCISLPARIAARARRALLFAPRRSCSPRLFPHLRTFPRQQHEHDRAARIGNAAVGANAVARISIALKTCAVAVM